MTKLSVRDMVLVGFFAALMAVGAFISKIWPPDIIPFSLLPMLAMLAGLIIGPRLGALSIVVYILVGLTGVPVFASAPFGGITYIFKPTFGFLIGNALAAYVAGLIVHNTAKPGWVRYILGVLVAFVVIYLFGIPWMYLMFNFYLGKTITLGNIFAMMSLYMGLDLVKAGIAAVVGKTIFERVNYSQRVSGSFSQ